MQTYVKLLSLISGIPPRPAGILQIRKIHTKEVGQISLTSNILLYKLIIAQIAVCSGVLCLDGGSVCLCLLHKLFSKRWTGAIGMPWQSVCVSGEWVGVVSLHM